MQDITVQEVFVGTPQYQQVYDLRETVLRQPIGLSLVNEDLSVDTHDTILGAFMNDALIGCLMLQHKDIETVKFRQMAVASDWQGKGVGNILMSSAEEFCKMKGYHKVVLHARETAHGFYGKLGYHIKGDLFTEVGIPHYLMEKVI